MRLKDGVPKRRSPTVSTPTARPAKEERSGSPGDVVLSLQRGAGNAAVLRLLARAAVETPPTATARKTLRLWSTGDDVSFLQSRLNRAPDVATHLAVDGIFGPKTLEGVREFQSEHPPLKVDGVVGPRTWEAVEAIPDEPEGEADSLARKIFLRGAEAYGEGRFAHAYDFFTRAYELEPRSGLLFSRAQALRRLGGRRAEAMALYEEYLSRPGATRTEDAEAALAELRGPGKTGEPVVDSAAARALFEQGAVEYERGRFAHAYDKFTMAYELEARSGLLFSRAQALRRLGGRRAEAMALYEEYLSRPGATRTEDAEAALAELRGPGKTGEPVVDSAAARALFEQGAVEYERGRFAHAYDKFTMAYELEARSGLLFSRAQALRRLGGRREEAIVLYEAHLARPDGTRKAEARLWIDELRHSGAAP